MYAYIYIYSVASEDVRVHGLQEVAEAEEQRLSGRS